MSVFRICKNKDNPYVMVHKGIVMNPILSAKAKGILFYLLSRPDDWKVYENEITRHFRDGLRSIRSGIKELCSAGYIIRHRIHKPNGSFAGVEYIVHESPKTRAESTIMPKRNNAKGQATNKDLTNERINLSRDEELRLQSKEDSHEKWLDLLQQQVEGTIN